MKLSQRLRRIVDRRRLVEMLRDVLGADPLVVFAYLHGSVVSGHLARDVDVAVWLREGVDPLSYVVERGAELEARLGLPVDIQVLNDAPVGFRYAVYTGGILLVVRDPLLHDLEVAKTVLMYSDVMVLRRRAGFAETAWP